MKIYIVCQGLYSDRGIEAVFDEEASANNYIENHRDREKDGSPREWDYWDVEEWEVNATCPISPRIVWRVDMLKNGSTLCVNREPNGEELSQEFCQAYEGGKYLSEMKLISKVEAIDEKHAIKIVNERRAMLIAANEWPEYEPET